MPTTPDDVIKVNKQKHYFKNRGPLAEPRGDGRDFIFNMDGSVNRPNAHEDPNVPQEQREQALLEMEAKQLESAVCFCNLPVCTKCHSHFRDSVRAKHSQK